MRDLTDRQFRASAEVLDRQRRIRATSEHLAIEGHGQSRVVALADADRQAAQYFDIPVDAITAKLTRKIGRAMAGVKLTDGTVLDWEVDVTYKWVDPN